MIKLSICMCWLNQQNNKLQNPGHNFQRNFRAAVSRAKTAEFTVSKPNDAITAALPIMLKPIYLLPHILQFDCTISALQTLTVGENFCMHARLLVYIDDFLQFCITRS